MSEAADNYALLRKLRVDQAARWLEIHPFEVVRTLVLADALPSDLRLDAADVEAVRQRGGLETWWEDGADLPNPALLEALLNQLQARLANTAGTRSDNLFRGLDPARQVFLRRAVNQLVRTGYLDILMTARGLSVTLRDPSGDALRALLADRDELIALVARCDAEGA